MFSRRGDTNSWNELKSLRPFNADAPIVKPFSQKPHSRWGSENRSTLPHSHQKLHAFASFRIISLKTAATTVAAASAAAAARQLQCLFDLTYVNRETYLPLFARTQALTFLHMNLSVRHCKRDTIYRVCVRERGSTERTPKEKKRQRTNETNKKLCMKFQSWSKSFDCILICVRIFVLREKINTQTHTHTPFASFAFCALFLAPRHRVRNSFNSYRPKWPFFFCQR